MRPNEIRFQLKIDSTYVNVSLFSKHFSIVTADTVRCFDYTLEFNYRFFFYQRKRDFSIYNSGNLENLP